MVVLSAPLARERSSRVVLLTSLALNLFFLGLLGAGAVRHYLTPSSPAVVEPSRTAAERIDRLAATLPPDDADKLRAQFRARDSSLEAAHKAYRKAQQAVRAALRAEPFDAATVRSAMTESRGARQALDTALQEVIALAAGQFSAAGRHQLADWAPPVHNAPSAAR
jgi:uncharacterized membrane protein